VRGKPASPVLREGRRSNAPPLPDRTIRPVKVQQRSSGGCWRTLDGLADFAVVQSYLSTASKWGIPKIDALRGLFNGTPWMPTGLEPSG
jgi:transposase